MDNVNHPAHYTQYPHEVIELTSKFDFCTGNAIKYILRRKMKGGAEDLQKAKWYLEYAVDHPEVVKCSDPAGVSALARTYENTFVTDIADSVCCSHPEGTYPWIPAFARISEFIHLLEEYSAEDEPEEDPRQMHFPFWSKCNVDLSNIPDEDRGFIRAVLKSAGARF